MDTKANLLLETVSACSLTQFNTIPNRNNRYLDLIFATLSIGSVSVAETDPLCQVDCHHLAYIVEISNMNKDKPMKPNFNKRVNFNKCNYINLKADLVSVDWGKMLSSSDTDECVDVFYSKLDEIISKHTPSTKCVSNKYPAWYNRPLIKCMREKSKYHRRYKRFGNPRDYDTFALLRTRCKKLIKQCHDVFLSSVEESLENEPKVFWRYVNGKKGRSTVPNTMFYKSKESSDGQGICELFSEFFGSVYSSPSTTVSPESLELPVVFNSTLHNFYFTQSEIALKIKALDGRKGPGPDNIPPKFVKTCCKELLLPLYLIFNKSLETGMFPSRWKVAYIIPIFKSGDKTLCSNYRPISILSCFAKLFESLVYEPLYDHLKGHISSSQHGFVRKRSTLSNLLEFKNYLCHVFASGGQSDALYLDFSKAFDRVDHLTLCHKLSFYGVHGCLLRWLISYLNNRTQLVTMKGFSSTPISVSSGVPQGSHLGPLLFVIFINDLINRLSSRCLLYADDLKIYNDITDTASCIVLQKDLNTVSNWCVLNGMSLNVNKSCVISFTKKKNRYIHQYYIGDKVLSRSEVVRDLGVYFDAELTFHHHYEHIINKSNKLLGFIIRSTKEFRSPRSILCLFFSLVRSVLEYCCPIWSPHYNVHSDGIERVQKRCLKYISYRYGIGRLFKDYSERLSKFKMIALHKRRDRYDLFCLHKIVHSSIDAPNLLSSLNFNTRHRSRNPNIFALQVYKNNTSFFNPVVRMCRSFNELVRSGVDIDLFNGSFTQYKRRVNDIFENR